MAPQTQKQWTVQGIAKDFSNLTLNKEASIPELGDHDVLVKCKSGFPILPYAISLQWDSYLDSPGSELELP